MKELKFKDLQAEDVEARVGSITGKGFSILLYKDARCDVRQLNDVVGAYNWQVERYEKIDGVLYCFVSIWDEDKKQWITKGDCGIESKQQDDNKVKAESSDAFKRACYKWGIGIKLYNFKNIFIPCDIVERNGKKNIPYDYQYLDVAEIDYDNMKVVFKNSKGKITWQQGKIVENTIEDKLKSYNKPATATNINYNTDTYSGLNNSELDRQPYSNKPTKEQIEELLQQLNSDLTADKIIAYFEKKNWKTKSSIDNKEYNVTIKTIEYYIKQGWLK